MLSEKNMTSLNRILSISVVLILLSMVLLSMCFWASVTTSGTTKGGDSEIEKLKMENLILSKTIDSLKIEVETSGFVIDKYETCVMLLEEESKDCWIKFDLIYKNHE